MAKKNLLHRNKLEQFKQWLIDKGYEPESNCGVYEVLRWSFGADMPMIFNGSAKDHYTCNESSIRFVRQFISETNKKPAN